jgi:hypothetical protein
MKIFACLALFILLGAGVNAQQTPAPAPAARITGGTSLLSETIVKGSPFSAEAVNESVQMLADGNRIVRSSTNKLYRNSEGRFRREISGGSGGALGSFYSVGPGITILDPVAGHRYLLDSHLMTARIGSLGGFATTVTPALPPKAPLPPSAERQSVREKIQAELNAAGSSQTAVELAEKAKVLAEKEKAYANNARAYGDAVRVYGDSLTGAQGGTFAYSIGGHKSKYETRTEDLGVQSIEGVEATGTRTVTTIPAGDIGNERPIEIVYEKWYSKELQLVVMSKHSDPRFGEQTYRLTNIVRSEPDPSLFEVPSGYKVSGIAPAYKIGTSQGSGQNVVYTKAASPTATMVRTTKP